MPLNGEEDIACAGGNLHVPLFSDLAAGGEQLGFRQYVGTEPRDDADIRHGKGLAVGKLHAALASALAVNQSVAPDSNVDAAWDDIEAIGVALRDVTGGGTVNEDAASHEPRRVDCSKLFVVGGESEFLAFLGGSLGFLGVSLRPAIFFSMVVN